MIDKVADESVMVSRWENAFRFVFDYPNEGPPTLTIHHEQCTQEGDGPAVCNTQEPIVIPYTDPAATFPIYNIDTGAETGSTKTHGELFQMLYSLFKYQVE